MTRSLRIFYIALFLVTLLWLGETNKYRSERIDLGSLMRGSGEMLRDRNFLGHILPLGFAFALNFGMLAGVPFILQESLGFSPKEFGLMKGIALMPEFMIEEDLRSGALVPLLSDYSLPEIPISLVYPTRKNMTAALRAQGTASQAAADQALAAATSATARVTVATQSLEAARANLWKRRAIDRDCRLL